MLQPDLMESQFGGKSGHIYGPVLADSKAGGKRTLEWDLNDWRWDGDLLLATPSNPPPSDCRSRQFFPVRPETPQTINISNSLSPSSDELDQNGGGNLETEKRRRAVVVPVEELNSEAGSLNLKLGGQTYPIPDEAGKWEGKGGKKTKYCASSPTHPVCQVEDCRADLSNAKDYHRRHKVCDMHSKASQALVGNVMQRFCQQCSRFHVLQEFDDGKRSCRRRLAGHNKRRRKAHLETSVNIGSLNDEQSSSYLLMSLLRMLSNVHTSSTDQKKDQDLLFHLVNNLAIALNQSNISGMLPQPDSQDVGLSIGALQKELPGAAQLHEERPSAETCKRVSTHDAVGGIQQAASAVYPRINETDSVPGHEIQMATAEKRNKLAGIDLNTEYAESQDLVDNQEKAHSSLDCFDKMQNIHQSSPPQTVGNSESTSARSPSSSSGSDAQSRTDRIIFKLFGKDPHDLPLLLRRQILDWLSHSPTNIEGFIRPGCIVLTIYLRLDMSSWQELHDNLGSSLSRLLDISDDSFWRTGWIYVRMQNHASFICNGQVVLDLPFLSKSHITCQISSVSPLAVSATQRAQFVIRGSNLSRSTSRLMCAIEGKYLAPEGCDRLQEGDNGFTEHDDVTCLRFSCSIPDISGRGFIEIEDFGFSGSFFPLIVAEPDVCAEINTLERAMEVPETADEIVGRYDNIDARNQALDFLHEMGWLLHRKGMRSRSADASILQDFFPFERVKYLFEFSIDRDWCAVVKKLLDLLFDGIVDVGMRPSIEHALLEMGLLHQAVRRNCKPMVESLLRYIPQTVTDRLVSGEAERNQQKQVSKDGFLFRPDDAGPSGLTPLHVAASSDGYENVLEALIEDPGMIGIEAWRNARDNMGLTPYDYACLRGHYSLVHLVHRKISKLSPPPHVVVDIPATIAEITRQQKQADKVKTNDPASFQIETYRQKSALGRCKRCELKLDYGRRRTLIAYKPMMLSMLAIAAVCVCAALLFKSSPEVYVFKPFSWESLKYGAM